MSTRNMILCTNFEQQKYSRWFNLIEEQMWYAPKLVARLEMDHPSIQ